jgi:SAM-dependent methyltransferase
MAGIAFETDFTYEFIKRSLPFGCRRILEVGCGTGEVAACLLHDGFDVTAIDIDQQSVDAARSLGVDARLAEWPHFNEGSYDAVLFTRSLHHIKPLAQAVQSAAECLRDGGHIIVEDFDYDSADERTLQWFTSVARIVEAAGLLLHRDGLFDELLSSNPPAVAWRNHHPDDLHSANEIAAALHRTMGNLSTETAPYFFRYLAKALGNNDLRDGLVEALCEQEKALINNGAIVAIGRRFVAKRTTSPND